ncbi:DUF5990 family protein [Knoellia subterranea]|uniref:Monooxygenase n=1 Tax=Knoellia subterranea KCTC 19937 TaxID=1385521 RepID=A0A0A0JP37_9MICO|nr:DUF5990 family protein [Knoellia subterranea]KGN37822.1 hypothetical protein N803_12240 [Knoellia subterranea KCTC 19937]
MEVRIVGEPLPDPVVGGRAVLVGMPRGRVVESPRPVAGSSMTFVAELDVVVTPEGVDYRGPWVQGRKGERFLYLSWGHDDGDGFVLDRRAKLMLGVLDPADMLDARPDAVLEGRLSLVDARGGPVCAAVRPPAIRWRLVASER